MSNKSKYIDRSPNIRTAGKIFQSNESVGDSLRIYSPEEAALNILNMKCKKHSSLGYSRFLPGENVKDLLSPELKKTRFVAFKEKFFEDLFFKKPELGQVSEVQSKPEELTNENFTYGLKYNLSERAYDLILPNKTAKEVRKDFLKWHDKYVISHKHYLPAERIKRKYNENFNPQALFGISSNVDKTGQMVKKCLQQCDRLVVINKAQKEFLDRTSGELGKKVDRYNLILDPQQTFGIRTKNHTNYDVRALIENVRACEKKTNIIEVISYINKLRHILFNRTDFHMHDLKTLLNKYDERKTGIIEFKSILKALKTLRINVSEEKIRFAIKYFEILQNENEDSELVDLEKFLKMLHIQYPLPRKTLIYDVPSEESNNKQTTYRLLCSDLDKALVPQKAITKSPKQSDDDRCRVSDLITPGIPIQYGLAPSDFEILRTKEEISRIFKRLLLPKSFHNIWQFAWQEKCSEDSCKMSVNEFRATIQKYNKRNVK